MAAASRWTACTSLKMRPDKNAETNVKDLPKEGTCIQDENLGLVVCINIKDVYNCRQRILTSPINKYED